MIEYDLALSIILIVLSIFNTINNVIGKIVTDKNEQTIQF